MLGFRPAAVAQAIEDAPGTDNPARPLIEEVEGVTRGVAVQDSPKCIAGIAIGQSPNIETGEIMIEVEGRPHRRASGSPTRSRCRSTISAAPTRRGTC